MRVLITGASGFIGQNLARHLRYEGRGTTLIGVDRRGHGCGAEAGEFDHFYRGCFTDAAALELAAGADVTVHLAAEVSVQGSLADPIGTIENNVLRSLRLLDHLRRHQRRTHFVFASTGAASRDGRQGPASPYGASKLGVEALLEAYGQSWGLDALSLQFANVYGPLSWRQGGVIPQMCRRALAGEAITINGDGGQTRDYVHVSDICRAISGAVQRRSVGRYQLGTGVATSLTELVELLRDLLPECRFDVVHGPRLDGELRHHCADIAAACTDLGYFPTVSLREGLAQTLSWYRAEGIGAAEKWRLSA